MSEGPKKLNLTLKVTDRIVKLSSVVSDYTHTDAKATITRFDRWVKNTREILEGQIDRDTVSRFDRLPRPGEQNDSLEEIHYCSREHSDFLRDLVKQIDES
jgi:hypothetical protein